MIAPNHLTTALYFADRARRARSDDERDRLSAVARRYRVLAIVEGRRFILQIPKRPAASSVRWRYAPRKRA
jgi:hypothetical protein